MRRLGWVWPSRGQRWRKPAIVAVSLGLHALVLGYVGFKAFDPPRLYGDDGPIDDPIFPWPVIYAEIEPRPLLRGEVARTRETPAPDPAMSAIPDAGTRVTAPAPPADVGTAAWRVRPGTLGDRVGRGLRTSPVGCASPHLLSAAERAVCDDRFGARAAAAAPIEGTGNPERDARFAREGARALANYEARRRPLAGGTGNVGVQEVPGSNFGMGVAGAHLDPALRPDSSTNVRTRRDRTRELEED